MLESRISFLDNLESNLKALESRSERDPEALAREAAAREAARSAALEIAPYAEALRSGPFKDGLLTASRDIGHRKRTLVRPVWVDSTLRLEAGAKNLELRKGEVEVVERDARPAAASRACAQVRSSKFLGPGGTGNPTPGGFVAVFLDGGRSVSARR